MQLINDKPIQNNNKKKLNQQILILYTQNETYIFSLKERPLIPTDLTIRTMFGFIVTHPPTQGSEHP